MNVELINNHVLFPEPANWSEKPSWQRRWQNVVSPSITGAESRLGVRAEPRSSLTWRITRSQIVDLACFDDRIRAAKKSGRACSAFHGRGYILQADVTAATAVLDRDWSNAFAPYILFVTSDDLYEVREVVGVDANTITLDDDVARTYGSGSFCWPLIFGKFTCEEMPARTPQHANLKLTISELVSPSSAQLGEVEVPVGSGIGFWHIEDNFVVS